MRYGVVTGCDGTLSWMIPWWIERVRKYSPDIEIAFADFGGITEKMQKWIRSEVNVYIDLSQAQTIRSWFKKPLAIYHSPFDKVIWLDSDCEVQSDFTAMFDRCAEDYIGLTWDHPGREIEGINGNIISRSVATGVVVTIPKNELIHKWCDMCLKARGIRGDQEVLNWILDGRRQAGNRTTKINIMPKEYQWLRLEGHNPNAVIMHWTGPIGKNYIANQIDPKIHYERTF